MVTLGKRHRRSSTVQEEGLTNDGRQYLLLLHKQEHKKEALQNHYMHTINTAGLSECEV